MDENAWADAKFRGIIKTKTWIIVPEGKAANKPVKNAVPTSKNGLVNPNKPIFLTTNDNKITLGFDSSAVSRYDIIKLLDSKGKTLGEITYNI